MYNINSNSLLYMFCISFPDFSQTLFVYCFNFSEYFCLTPSLSPSLPPSPYYLNVCCSNSYSSSFSSPFSSQFEIPFAILRNGKRASWPVGMYWLNTEQFAKTMTPKKTPIVFRFSLMFNKDSFRIGDFILWSRTSMKMKLLLLSLFALSAS